MERVLKSNSEYIPTKPIWLVFDANNGHKAAKRYVWWFDTKKQANDWIKFHVQQPHAHEISEPIKWQRCEKDLSLWKLYEELTARNEYLDSLPKTKENKWRSEELELCIVRVQQLLLPTLKSKKKWKIIQKYLTRLILMIKLN